MATPPKLVFERSFDSQTGKTVAVAPGLMRVTAPNASPYTFTGTNSFLVGHEQLALIDPGPDDSAHRTALEQAIAGRPVSAIILTHTHRDHSAGAAQLAAELNAPLWFGGAHRLSRPLRAGETNALRRSSDWELQPDRVLRDGETILAGDLELLVHTTPGHCANHLAFGLTGTDTVLTGDHVMGWNSTLVASPDGSMADYLQSLEKLIALPYRRYVPAHGGPIEDGPSYARALLAHRQERNRQIIAAVEQGARSIPAIVRALYPDVSLPVRRAAAMTVGAQLEYLADLGRLRLRSGLLGLRVSL
ncbi:MBL fold metallo-hydrolase [Devosia sp. 1566]|uniref:MBL fold metallo-hydrolase n=1 Tax=Devosia sp. 1566 TaxID=2499144 RepID=UPI000FDCCF6E|nr:MBL fold metallo-hydrolase [Devosia sp. 1566]